MKGNREKNTRAEAGGPAGDPSVPPSEPSGAYSGHAHAEAASHEAAHSHHRASPSGSDEEESKGEGIRLAAATGMLAIGLVASGIPWLSWALYLAAAAIAALPVMWGAFQELRHTAFGEQTLLIIAVVAAFVIGEGREGAAVAVLFAWGEWWEDRAVERSHQAIRALADVRPDVAWRRTEEGALCELSAEEVQVGDVLEIPPHRRIAVDCEVVAGESEVDVSALTGESTPMAATPHTVLLSGGINGGSALTVRALRPAEQSAAARMLALVQDSSAQGGTTEKFITRFARVYTPTVVGAAVVLALVGWLSGWLAPTRSIHRALTFLVAACPCALVISVPLSFTAGMGAASRQGVLIKGGRYLERLARVQAVAVDKTGTLTTGRSEVIRMETAEGVSPEQALSLVLALEQEAEHPLARALTEAARARGVSPASVSCRHERPAYGVEATYRGQPVVCGGRRMLDERGMEAPREGDAWLVCGTQVWAAFTVASEVRADSSAAVAQLRELGVKDIVMLTGDREEPARETARQVGITQVEASLLPEQKQQAVKRLQQQYGATAFVGDGINDAPVLAAADVGIAMGRGSAAAIETGDVVLMGNELSRLPAAIRLSRRVMRTVRQNVGFALGVKAAVLLMAACGVAPMWLAVFSDVGVTCLCVLRAAQMVLTERQKKSTL